MTTVQEIRAAEPEKRYELCRKWERDRGLDNMEEKGPDQFAAMDVLERWEQAFQFIIQIAKHEAMYCQLGSRSEVAFTKIAIKAQEAMPWIK